MASVDRACIGERMETRERIGSERGGLFVLLLYQFRFRCVPAARNPSSTGSFSKFKIVRGTHAASSVPTATPTSATSASPRATTSTARTTSFGQSRGTFPTRTSPLVNILL